MCVVTSTYSSTELQIKLYCDLWKWVWSPYISMYNTCVECASRHMFVFDSKCNPCNSADCTWVYGPLNLRKQLNESACGHHSSMHYTVQYNIKSVRRYYVTLSNTCAAQLCIRNIPNNIIRQKFSQSPHRQHTENISIGLNVLQLLLMN